jgi:Asp-tRNA(Asn)/Glu-tRNA(Gln) amidotransferase A subunit family amidase
MSEESGLPVGLQIIAGQKHDAVVLVLAAQLQQEYKK